MARPRLSRAIAAITGVSVAMLVAAVPASAEDDPAKATFLDKHEAGAEVTVVFKDEDPLKVPTQLSEIQLKDGPAVKTYGLFPGMELKKDAPLIEVPLFLDDESVKTLKVAKLSASTEQNKLNWLLRHSYPFVSLDKLPVAGITNKEAIAATQVAIWHLLVEDLTLDDGNGEHVTALYDFLTGDENTGATNDKEPDLELTPATGSGKAGEKVGPVTVKTTAKELTLTAPEGVKVLDKDGKEIAAKDIKDGTELFFQVPAGAAGQGTVELKATGEVSRAFGNLSEDEEIPAPEVKIAAAATADDGEGEPEPTQILVFAQTLSKSVKVDLSWTSSETPAPQGSSGGGLANTGVSIYVPLGIAVLLLLAGGGALLFLRRRRA